jgi:hypothetical protein
VDAELDHVRDVFRCGKKYTTSSSVPQIVADAMEVVSSRVLFRQPNFPQATVLARGGGGGDAHVAGGLRE